MPAASRLARPSAYHPVLNGPDQRLTESRSAPRDRFNQPNPLSERPSSCAVSHGVLGTHNLPVHYDALIGLEDTAHTVRLPLDLVTNSAAPRRLPFGEGKEDGPAARYWAPGWTAVADR